MSDNTCATCALGALQSNQAIYCHEKLKFKRHSDTCDHHTPKPPKKCGGCVGDEAEELMHHNEEKIQCPECSSCNTAPVDEFRWTCNDCQYESGFENFIVIDATPQPTAGHEPGWKKESSAGCYADKFHCYVTENEDSVCRVDGVTREECDNRADLIAKAPTLAAENEKLRIILQSVNERLKKVIKTDDDWCGVISVQVSLETALKVSALTEGGDDG